MTLLIDNFRKALRGERVDNDLFIPIFIWLSGYEQNIEKFQLINKRIFNVKRKVLISELAYSNTCKSFIKYPKVKKEDEKLDFFYKDVCKYFGWTRRELRINLQLLDLGELKETIAKLFAYDNKERRIIGLAKFGGITNVRNKSV